MSRNWVVLDVVGKKLVGTVRIPDPWFRLRSIGATGIFTTYRDEEGSSHIVKLGYLDGFGACAD